MVQYSQALMAPATLTRIRNAQGGATKITASSTGMATIAVINLGTRSDFFFSLMHALFGLQLIVLARLETRLNVGDLLGNVFVSWLHA